MWLAGFGIVAGAVALGAVVRFVLFRLLRRLFEKTETRLDDILLDASGVHVVFWFFLAGVRAGAGFFALSAPHLKTLNRVLIVCWGVSLTLWAARVLGETARLYIGRMMGERTSSSLTVHLTRLIIVLMGGLLILSNLGVSITPLITALGVGSLAVALALQDTLSNIFAGFYILLNRQIHSGDYIKLDSGQEGHVQDIGWRVTTIKSLPNEIIIIPNAKLGQAIVTNYHLPVPEMACLVNVGVGYHSDLEAVEKVTVEVARDVQKAVAGAVPAFEPFIRYGGFGDSSVNFTVILRAKDFTDRPMITHEFIKRLHKRYGREGIDIPFPQRVVHIEQPLKN